MTTNQEARQAGMRTVTSASEVLNGDWHALWDNIGIPDGTFNERMLAWINDQLSASYTNLQGAMYAYAADQGFDSWSAMGSGVDLSDANAGGGGTTGEAIGLLLVLTKAS